MFIIEYSSYKIILLQKANKNSQEHYENKKAAALKIVQQLLTVKKPPLEVSEGPQAL